MKKRRYFGLIPAAGHSRRMGTHKLMMPWKTGRVIDSVLLAWKNSFVDHIVVVVRQNDHRLIEACEEFSVGVLKLSVETQDMKQTIHQGLNFIQQRWSPIDVDVCLIAPADLPKLTSDVVNAVANEVDGDKIVTPTYGEKNGHPTAFPWPITKEIFQLGNDEGLNSLIDRSPTKKVYLDKSLRPRDIDTLEDYKREIE